MRLNEHTAILSSKVMLVPYSSHHVESYHEWMQDEELQKATASEPLTLEEEYAMQKSWRLDADKLTFIACTVTSNSQGSISGQATKGCGEQRGVVAGRDDGPDRMLGDVNLFLYPVENEEEQAGASAKTGQSDVKDVIGEVEIMIARKELQGNGYAEYHKDYGKGHARSSLKYLRVKVDYENSRSIRLFESVGFHKLSHTPNYFGELELRRPIEQRSPAQSEARLTEVPICVDYALGYSN